MKNLTSIVLLVSFTICGAYGQTFTITGKVVDEQNRVVPYANILLLEAVDSTFVQQKKGIDGLPVPFQLVTRSILMPHRTNVS